MATPKRAKSKPLSKRRASVKRAPKSSGRTTIPLMVRQEVLLEAGYMCANPRCRYVLTLELHHLCWVRDGGGNDPSNLLALCRNCHGLHTGGHIPNSAMRAWKSMLASLNAIDRMGVDHLLYLFAEDKKYGDNSPVRYTNDTKLLLARLFNAGLLESPSGIMSSGSPLGASSAWKISLTPRCRRIVEAWLAGLPDELGRALEERPTA